MIDYDLGAVAGAVVHAQGIHRRARIVIDEQRQVLIGARHAVPAYPTVSEVWLRLLEQYGRRHA